MRNNEKFLEQVAYVQVSKHRTNILLFMQNELYTPKQIGDGVGVRTNHISNLLSQLKKFNLVYCATPNIRKGKLYALTEDGLNVLKYLKQKQEALLSS